MFGKISKSREIDVSVEPSQILAKPGKLDNLEGIAFSSSGDVIGVAALGTNSVFLFRRRADGRFDDTPYLRIGGPNSGLRSPHDVSFSRSGNTEWLAIAQRHGAIAIYEKNPANENYGPTPAFEIHGANTKLDYSDGVAFVPPDGAYLAACNVGSITFYRRVSRDPLGFALEPVFELKHPSLSNPDGLAFSRCGRWLAIANHGSHSVSIFQRRNMLLSGGKLEYGPMPVTIIEDVRLRYPHSVAFTPATNHLVVTNAGANFFCVYEPKARRFGVRWSQSPVVQRYFGPDHVFKEVNEPNKMEGGPKGVATHQNSLAVCSPEFGVKIYSIGEGRR